VLNTVSTAGQTLRLHGTGTQVSIIRDGPTADNGEEVRILGVDPATFSRYAYVDDAERRQVEQLSSSASDGRVTAIVANLDRAGPIHSVTVSDVNARHSGSGTVEDATLELDVIATPTSFPGLRDPYSPMIIVDRRALTGMPDHIERAEQVWTGADDRAAAVRVLDQAHVSVLFELSPPVLVGNTGLLPVTWVLSYLRALALLIGLVAMAGLVFALASRARRTAVAYILTRRMGVRRRTHLASLVVELTLIVGVGWLAGTALAEGSLGVVYRLLDTYPAFPPAPRFIFDGVAVAGLGVAAAVVVLAASALAQLLADRADPAATMREL
jgi:putative ABC transport system permease protein